MTTGSGIKGTSNKRLVPALRFPEFEKDGEWEEKELYEVANRKIDKNKKNIKLPVLTNSAIYGVILQKDYFDRKIVTNDNLVNYQIVECNDFVYNPRISAESPVGPISRNKICLGIMSPLYTIFRFKEKKVDYFEYYFETDVWHEFIKRRANYGARFDRINISTDDFFNLPIPYPSLLEQQKIAECLSSIDEEISAMKEKVEQLKIHKKGFMQKLFPVVGKFVPEVRFPEFKKDREWKEQKLEDVARTYSGGTPSVNNKEYYNGDIPFIRSGEINKDTTELFLTHWGVEKSSAKIIKEGTILYALYGATSGEVAISKIEGAINQAILAIIPDTEYSSLYIYQYLKNEKKNIINSYLQGGQGNLSGTIINNLRIPFPSPAEQQKIAECLASIDELISLYENKVTLLEQHKKGLMQQLFPKL